MAGPGRRGAAGLKSLNAGLILLGFLLAALAKSALLPFSAWIARALEGPTPSSAVFYGSLMVHAGVYLLIRVEPLFVQAPALMPLIGPDRAGDGPLRLAHRPDPGGRQERALMFSTTTQVGLMVLWCGLGWFELATAHLILHALWRAYQFLHAPALMHWTMPPRGPPGPRSPAGGCSTPRPCSASGSTRPPTGSWYGPPNSSGRTSRPSTTRS